MKTKKGIKKQSRQSNPQLPRVIWERFKKRYPDSLVFTPLFAELRQTSLDMSELEDPLATDLADSFPQVLTVATATTKGLEGGSWLHFSVTQGDLPLAHESLRLGASVQSLDRRNYSALYFAAVVLKDILLPDGPVSGIYRGSTPSATAPHAFVEQNIQICLLLLEHHADANETHDGLSLLGLACLSDQWDLIRALLRHGANPFPSLSSTQPPIEFLKTVGARRVFTTTISQLSGKPRPRMLCPCGSERALDKCHVTPLPYPDDDLCPCGSGKTHRVCCVKRADMTWVERWDPSEARLKRVCMPGTSTFPALKTNGHVPTQRELRSQLEEVHTILRKLGKSGRVDPAFVALWNDAVDKYILSKVDRRPRQAIENAVKVGLTGGPLYRRCEADGCPKIEGRNGVKLSRCGGCSKFSTVVLHAKYVEDQEIEM
ncbi:hypothetical protein B0H16DRAFT_1832487 [Mycena metata]|uniref:Ankyrin n=1 Tax=Mycena metata TaxID=1033252 RepID=A0AAD7J0I9_9AGAR|nr:hypothetical protein B0H16DRAFT_1832487 [Mycena metata]